jgi:hypothetical protein
MAASERPGMVKNAKPKQSPWTMPRLHGELGGEWRATVEREEDRRRRSGAMERKDGARHVAGRVRTVAVDHAKICGGMGSKASGGRISRVE